jgi:hypothetical protein
VLALSAHRPLDPVGVDVDYEGVAELPGWAADIPRVARGVLGCGREVRGAALLAYVDVPEESGLGAEAARRCGLARAMAGVSGTAVTPDELLLLLEGEGWQAAANAACLLGRRGQAALIPAGFRGCARMLCHAPFDPAAVGVRLVAMTLRPVEPEAPDPEWEPDLSEDARVVDGFEALLAGGPEGMERLGELLSESHQACHGRRERAAADRVVAMALSAGALGARATSPSTILALVPASALRSLRTAVVDAFRNRGLPVPRFLTTGAAAAAVSEPPESLLEA